MKSARIRSTFLFLVFMAIFVQSAMAAPPACDDPGVQALLKKLVHEQAHTQMTHELMQGVFKGMGSASLTTSTQIANIMIPTLPVEVQSARTVRRQGNSLVCQAILSTAIPDEKSSPDIVPVVAQFRSLLPQLIARRYADVSVRDMTLSSVIQYQVALADKGDQFTVSAKLGSFAQAVGDAAASLATLLTQS